MVNAWLHTVQYMATTDSQGIQILKTHLARVVCFNFLHLWQFVLTHPPTAQWWHRRRDLATLFQCHTPTTPAHVTPERLITIFTNRLNTARGCSRMYKIAGKEEESQFPYKAMEVCSDFPTAWLKQFHIKAHCNISLTPIYDKPTWQWPHGWKSQAPQKAGISRTPAILRKQQKSVISQKSYVRSVWQAAGITGGSLRKSFWLMIPGLAKRQREALALHTVNTS